MGTVSFSMVLATQWWRLIVTIQCHSDLDVTEDMTAGYRKTITKVLV